METSRHMHVTSINCKPLAVTVAIVIALSARPAPAVDETAATSSAKLSSLFSLQHVSFNCKHLQYAKSPNLQNETLIADKECAVARDSERWRFYQRGHLTDLVEGK